MRLNPKMPAFTITASVIYWITYLFFGRMVFEATPINIIFAVIFSIIMLYIIVAISKILIGDKTKSTNSLFIYSLIMLAIVSFIFQRIPSYGIYETIKIVLKPLIMYGVASHLVYNLRIRIV